MSDSQLLRLAEVMSRLRRECPWDAEQTHRSLVPYLIEEVSEVVDAIEAGTDVDLVEELGDLLLQVYFHAVIAAERDSFTIDDVAGGIADKLVLRHPHVFAGAPTPEDKDASWEAAKRAEKGRSSAIEGIANSLPTLARLQKVLSRARSHGVELDLDAEPIGAAEVGAGVVALVARAQASGLDADQAVRQALRALEAQIQVNEGRTAEAGIL